MRKVRVKCKDGHIADSLSKMIVDNWLHDHNLEHERNVKYPESNMNCDFYLPKHDLWLEYFGLLGEHSAYDEKVERKKELVKKFNLKFVYLIPEHLYPKERIIDVMGNIV